MNWLLSLLSAVLLLLLFPRPILPNISLAILAPIALTPLIVACAREPRRRTRFLLGYLTGVLYWFGLCSWIQGTLAQYAGVGPVTAWFVFLGFSLLKGLQTG